MLHSRFEWASATVRPHARGGRAYREVLEEQAARSGTASLYQVGRGFWCLELGDFSCEYVCVCVRMCRELVCACCLCIYLCVCVCVCVCVSLLFLL
jgi:hypothetical protein